MRNCVLLAAIGFVFPELISGASVQYTDVLAVDTETNKLMRMTFNSGGSVLPPFIGMPMGGKGGFQGQ